VRNPWDRAVSAFWSDMSGGQRSAAEEMDFADLARAFRAWLTPAEAARNMDKLTLRGRPCIGAALAFERLEADLAALFDRLGAAAPPALPRLKEGRRGFAALPYTDWYDGPSRALVARAAAFEIAAFGYRFEDPAPAAGPPRWPRHRWLAPR
ncbi:MAG: hypothetical protein AAFW69_12620, partial [Pseudomonadota bacterium]